jgi:iron(III) transport system ATP-binding protein
MSAIELRGVSKRFGRTEVLTNVELEVPVGSTTAILGASGSGKTTLLRLIAGFDQPDAGRIAIGGRTVDDGRLTVRPQDRGVGYVPQDGALFPHLTVAGNVGFGLGRREQARAREMLELVGLGSLARRYPHELSGGQQQRVALGRALAIRPQVVLLDEPFSSLDATLRVELRRDVTRILKETATTTVLVTHDQDEALTLADEVAMLSGGGILVRAQPRKLYHHPPDLTAATSLGEANVLEAVIHAGLARCALGTVAIHANGQPQPEGPSRLLLRPEQLALHAQPVSDATKATVTEVHFHGHDTLAYLKLDDAAQTIVISRCPGDLPLAPGQGMWIEVLGPGRAWPDRVPDAD